MNAIMRPWNLLFLAAFLGVAAAACGNAPKIQHAQCTSSQVEAPDESATKSGGCGDGGTIVMKCVDLSTGTLAGKTGSGS